MIPRLALIVVCCTAWLPLSPPASAEVATRFRWPEGIRAAVSLAYDDALDSQLDHAAPALDRHGLKGSFYLQLSSPSVSRRLRDWRALAARGHELGNHTLFHQCSGTPPDRGWVAAHRDADALSVAQMVDQVTLANTMLQAIDGRRERSFTAPCGERKVGGGDYVGAVADSFVAIKIGADSGIAASMETLDLAAVPVEGPVGLSGRQLIALVERAGERGTMLNLTFHGIGGEHLAVSREAHEELVRYLAANRHRYWTDSFVNIMRYVKKEQARVRAARSK